MGLFEPHGRYRRGHGQVALTVAGFLTIDDMPALAGKRVLVRADLNVPMAAGKVTDATRLAAAVPTLAALADRGAIVLVLSHFGRPKGRDAASSLAPVAAALGEQLGRHVGFIDDCAGPEVEAAVAELAPGVITVELVAVTIAARNRRAVSWLAQALVLARYCSPRLSAPAAFHSAATWSA